MVTRSKASSEGQQRQRWQLWATVSILGAFAVAVIYMLVAAHDNDADVWQRRVYVFAGAQAIVFTAVGWLFGREVNSEALKAANAYADEAKDEARQAKDDSAASDRRTSEADAALADARSKERAARAAIGALVSGEAANTAGPRDISDTGAGTTSVQRIQAMLDEIYGA